MGTEEPPSDSTNDSSEQVISQLALAEMFVCVWESVKQGGQSTAEIESIGHALYTMHTVVIQNNHQSWHHECACVCGVRVCVCVCVCVCVRQQKNRRQASAEKLLYTMSYIITFLAPNDTQASQSTSGHIPATISKNFLCFKWDRLYNTGTS